MKSLLLAGAAATALACAIASSACSSTSRIPFEDEARKNNAAILAYEDGQRLEGEGKYDEAVASYELALPYSRIHDAALYKIGRLSSLLGDWEKAEDSFLAIIQDDPGNVAVRQSLAYVYCQSGREEEGLEAYRALHEERPHDEMLYQGYIKALKMNGLDEEAEMEEAEYDMLFARKSPQKDK